MRFAKDGGDENHRCHDENAELKGTCPAAARKLELTTPPVGMAWDTRRAVYLLDEGLAAGGRWLLVPSRVAPDVWPSVRDGMVTSNDHERRSGSQDAQPASLSCLALSAVVHHEYPEAAAHLKRLVELSDTTGSQAAEVAALTCEGEMYARCGELVDAASAYKRALLTCRSAGDKAGESLLLSNLAQVCPQIHALDAALMYAALAHVVALGSMDALSLQMATYWLAVIEHSSGNYAKAQTLYFSSLASARSLGDDEGDAYALVGHGVVGHMLNYLDCAEASYLAAIRVGTRSGNDPVVVTASLGLGAMHGARLKPSVRFLTEAGARSHASGDYVREALRSAGTLCATTAQVITALPPGSAGSSSGSHAAAVTRSSPAWH